MSGGRLRLLIYTTLFPNPSEPGRGIFVARRIAALARLAEILVVAPVNAGRRPAALLEPGRREDGNGVAVLHPRFAVLPGVAKGWDAALLHHETWPQIRGAVRARTFDVVDAHYAYPDGAAAARVARRLGRPLVVTVRGSDLEVLARDSARRPAIERTLRRAGAVVAVSDSLRRRALDLGVPEERIHVVGNGIDLARFQVGDRGAARRALGLAPDERVVLSVGRLDPIKGLDLLVEAAAHLPAHGAPVRIHLVGEGPMRAPLERAVRERGLDGRVLLHGERSPDALASWYAASDVVTLLSTSEGCPNVVIEALACGRPVVATRVGGVPELVREGETGLLVDRRDPALVAARLAEALGRAWDPDAIAGHVRERSWDRVAERLLDVYRGVLA